MREKADRFEFSNTEKRAQDQFIQGFIQVRCGMELNGMANVTSPNETFREPKSTMSSEANSVTAKMTKSSGNGSRGLRLCYFCRGTGHIVCDSMKQKDHRCKKCKREGHTGERCREDGEPHSYGQIPGQKVDRVCKEEAI